MKKLLFSAILILSIMMASYGKPANKNNDLVKGLTSALKSSQAASTFTTDKYRKTSFIFNDKTVSAYYDAESEQLIGFSIPMSLTDLPQGAADNIKAKFSAYTPLAMMMFIQKSGYFAFYVSLSRPEKPSIVVNISAKGNVRYFGKI